MEYFIIIIVFIIIVVVLNYLFACNKKQIEKMAKNEELDKIAQKYPDNIEMCKEYLNMLQNETVIIEEDEKASNSLYIAISNKIIIANLRESFTRIQTIAHECLHSIQDRKILLFNFIYSNIYMLYFIIISILAIIKVLPNKMVFLVFLIIGGFVYYFVRSYLENDAMIKARFLAKEYMENQNISSKEEIDNMVQSFDRLNAIGIKGVNYALFLNVMIEVIIFCIICIVR